MAEGLGFPTFTDVLYQLDGRRSGPSLLDLVTQMSWGKRPFKSTSDEEWYMFTYKTLVPTNDEVVRTSMTCTISLPIHDYMSMRRVELRVQTHEGLFGKKNALEHVFRMNRTSILMRGGVHQDPFFIPFYGHPHWFTFPDAPLFDWNKFYMPLSQCKDGTEALFPKKGQNQIYWALMYLAVSINMEDGNYTLRQPFPSREDAARWLLMMVKNTGWGD